MSPRAGLLACTAAALLAGCASGDPIVAPVFERTWAVPGGSFAETNVRMDADGAAVSSFEASSPVEWDVHSHDGAQVVTHLAGEGPTGAIRFVAPADGLYSFFFHNPNDDAVSLQVTITGDATLDSAIP